MRCKLACTAKVPAGDGTYLHFSPVYTGSEENKQFFKYTPGGVVSFNVLNPETADKFQVGGEYYVDFSPAD